MMSLPASERNFLFPGTKPGKPRNSGGYRAYVLSPLAKGLGIHGVTFTALRRTFATRAPRYEWCEGTTGADAALEFRDNDGRLRADGSGDPAGDGGADGGGTGA